MNRKQSYCDHNSKTIQEPLDQTAHIFVAYDSHNQIIGTVRVNYGKKGNLGIYESLYEMAASGDAHPNFTSITTKLMIASNHRKSRLGITLCLAAYKMGFKDGIRYDFIDTNQHLIKFFERLGYIALKDVIHPDYGVVKLMRLKVQDIEWLRHCRSPFYSIHDETVEKKKILSCY